ncbi:MAG: hypothetical protein HS117_19290 [Verrucomicrobiaceae bacterium]|nr:hypothetical protein [Verrucomicrobiaceae bacterium]
MKITVIIADDRRPEGWPECYTATKWDASLVDHRNQIERLVHSFNATLRAGELPRRILGITSEEIDEADAFNMGMHAYNRGVGREDNYWPADHANHPHWRDGWEEGRAIDEDGDDEEEGEGDE